MAEIPNLLLKNLLSAVEVFSRIFEPVIHIAGHQLPMLSTYGRAKPGDFLALINSFEVVEIAKSEGSAAEGLSSERGAPLIVTDGYTT